jgi:hypothetical protein
MIDNLTPGQLRVRNAIAANKRRRELRMAEELTARGWICIPPNPDKPAADR